MFTRGIRPLRPAEPREQIAGIPGGEPRHVRPRALRNAQARATLAAVDDHRLLPWMLRADMRDDRRAWLMVDLASWPVDQPLDPLPPVPVIAIGAPDHPHAARADVLVEPPITLAALTAGIAAAPSAAATLVQLLRAIDGLPAERALPIESFAFAMLQGGAEHAAWRARHPPAPPLAPGLLHAARDGVTLALTLDRPAALNGIDRALRDALHDAFTLAALDDTIARITLRGVGRCFSVGADLAEFGTTTDPPAAHAIRARTLPAHPLVRRTARLDVHVQGGCVGSGLELAAFADRLTAAPNAWFRLPEIAMGILPGFGGCVSVRRRIGRQRAAALMLSGRRIGVSTARDWGLVDALMDDPPGDDRHADEGSGQ